MIRNYKVPLIWKKNIINIEGDFLKLYIIFLLIESNSLYIYTHLFLCQIIYTYITLIKKTNKIKKNVASLIFLTTKILFCSKKKQKLYSFIVIFMVKENNHAPKKGNYLYLNIML